MSSAPGNHPQSCIKVEYLLAEPPSKVWKALTNAELLAAWLMPNDIRPEVGHRFTFRSQPAPHWDGVVHCEVLEVIPEKRLVYTWRSGAGDQPGRNYDLDTLVTWTLGATPEGGTLLRLQHSGFDEESVAFQAMSRGWRGKIAARISQALTA